MTFEMIFRCKTCWLKRQYGIANNLHDLPDNCQPTIRCQHCGIATTHEFTGVEVRSMKRESTIRGKFKGLEVA